MKNLVSKLLITLLILSISIPATAFADASQTNKFNDISGHWAEKQIKDWVTRGLVKGYEDGTFKPDAFIARAELITSTNHAFGFKDTSQISFSDVQANDWYYDEITKAQKVGYVTGYEDGTFKPNNNITRQEMAVVVSKLLSLKPSESASKFADTVESPSWSNGSIGAVIDSGLMNGYNKDSFGPNEKLTRAEATVILDRAVSSKVQSYDHAGTFGPESGVEKVSKDVVISVPGVTLQNMDITGDLLIGAGVGEGDVYLKNVKVHGTTTVKGGGEHSIHFENAVMVTVIVDKVGGNVRIVVSGSNSAVQEINIQSNARIESESGVAIDNVTLSSALPKDSKVQLAGTFETVNLLAKSIFVQIPLGSVKNMNVDKDAGNTQVDVSKDALITSLVLNAAANITGNGKVQTATINSPGITMESAPVNTKIGNNVPSDVTVNIGGKSTPASNVSSPPVSGGGNGSSSTTEPDPSPKPAPDTTAPVISGFTQPRVTQGERLNATSNENGKIYLVMSGYDQLGSLDDGIVAGGKVVNVKAGISVSFPTDSLDTTLGNLYVIVAVDLAGNISTSNYVRILDTSEKPLRIVDKMSNRINSVGLVLNKYVQADLTALKSSVTVSTYSAEEFHPLAEGDQVLFTDGGMVLGVTFADGYYGKQTRIKINAGALRNAVSESPINEEIISDYFTSSLIQTLLVSNPNGSKSITSSSDAVVYLVEQSVAIGDVAVKGVQINLLADTPTVVPTNGLVAGTYKLVTINGNVINNIVIN
ncbi:S-layer homology domain-containing protein [Paenibacillus sp. N3.4]|uniref:S-layer homology domain-containing protein n=1 Tax=Paenibacillus sp. N3.4 TaxID=2603222 RepID=UPI0011C8C98C|nr:S-layer homology domain-containing protein [Paenibacillus sp. N3.4]TXK85120.1 hypothetical protein FU659_05075 [Paenibacillus sp. N3.4]